MSTISNIAIHNSGGLGADRLASTRFLTFQDIDTYHKNKWGMQSSMGAFVGYNAIYDPKTREFSQFRAIGEETIAQRGHNFDTFSLCIIGNFNAMPIGAPKRPVDELSRLNIADIVLYLKDLINGNKRGLRVVTGTILNLSETRIYPHRALQSGTECHGTFYSDTYFRDEVLKYQTPKRENHAVILKKRTGLLQQIKKLQARLQRVRKERGLAGVGTTCDFIEVGYLDEDLQNTLKTS